MVLTAVILRTFFLTLPPVLFPLYSHGSMHACKLCFSNHLLLLTRRSGSQRGCGVRTETSEVAKQVKTRGSSLGDLLSHGLDYSRWFWLKCRQLSGCCCTTSTPIVGF